MKLLLLDLDGTLISNQKYEPNFQFSTSSFPLDDEFIIHKRPGLDEFLRWISKHFRLGIWTASNMNYAGPIVRKLLRDAELDYSILELFFTDKETNWNSYMPLKILKKVKKKGYSIDEILI